MTAVEALKSEGLSMEFASQDPLWHHMFKKSSVRLGSGEAFLKRRDEIETIARLVIEGRFSPDLHGFMCSSKGNGVARFVPVLTHRATSVYFACVREIDRLCADQAVEGTYGGWALGGERKKREEEAAKKLFEKTTSKDAVEQNEGFSVEGTSDQTDINVPQEESVPTFEEDLFSDFEIEAEVSVPSSPYNKAAWVQNWQEFWKVLAATTEDGPADEYIVSFDLANFYDHIDLDRLCSDLTALAGSKKYALYILFTSLRNWNREVRHYLPSSKGLPMDMIGDMSRVLANYYLVEFDQYFRKYVESNGGKFLRFADDMTFTCQSEKEARNTIFVASQRLHKMGLYINTAKVKIRQQSDFLFSWGFDVMDLLQQPEHLTAGISVLRTRWDDTRYERKVTALKRAITLLKDRADLEEERWWAYEAAMALPDYPLHLSPGQMDSLSIMAESEIEATSQIAKRIMDSPYSEPKAHLLRFVERKGLHAESRYHSMYIGIRNELREGSDRVLAVAAWNSPYGSTA